MHCYFLTIDYVCTQLKLADRDGEHYRYGYTANKEVLEQKKYKGCVVIVHMPVSCGTV